MSVSNLEYYRTFFVTASVLSFTKAAEQLYLTQPAVSQSIKKLEGELGTTLFERGSRGLSLTREGEILYHQVKKAFYDLQVGEDNIKDLSTYRVDELNIGATETALRFYLAQRFEKFKELYPETTVTIIGSTNRDICQKLDSGEIIAAFLVSPIPEEYNYFYLIPVREVQDIFVASRNFPIHFEERFDAMELSSYPLISVSADYSFRKLIDSWFLDEEIIYTPGYTVDHFGDILPLVDNGLGIGILPLDYVTGELSTGKLLPVKTDRQLPRRTMYLAIDATRPVPTINEHILQLFLDTELKIQ